MADGNALIVHPYKGPFDSIHLVLIEKNYLIIDINWVDSEDYDNDSFLIHSQSEELEAGSGFH